jgi:hypothetical protein
VSAHEVIAPQRGGAVGLLPLLVGSLHIRPRPLVDKVVHHVDGAPCWWVHVRLVQVLRGHFQRGAELPRPVRQILLLTRGTGGKRAPDYCQQHGGPQPSHPPLARRDAMAGAAGVQPRGNSVEAQRQPSQQAGSTVAAGAEAGGRSDFGLTNHRSTTAGRTVAAEFCC